MKAIDHKTHTQTRIARKHLAQLRKIAREDRRTITQVLALAICGYVKGRKP